MKKFYNRLGINQHSLIVIIFIQLILSPFLIDAQKPIFTSVGHGYEISTAVYAGNDEEFYVGDKDNGLLGMAFSKDGTKLFALGSSDAVIEYLLSTAFDVSTAAYSQEFYVGLQQSTPYGLRFSSDGTKMFISGSSGDSIEEYLLSTAYDVSTASHLGDFYVGSEETAPYGLEFNNDGTKMFVIGVFGDGLAEYTLSTAYDITTAVYAGEEEEFLYESDEPNPRGMSFNDDGTKMFVVGSTLDVVREYYLETPYDVSTVTNVDETEEFYVGIQESSPSDVAFNAIGSKMFIVGSGGDAVVEYDLSSIIEYDENDSEEIIDIDANNGQGGATDASVTYSLEGEDADLFNINASGIISFNTSPDFEAPLDDDIDNIYKITALADNMSEQSHQNIEVRVGNVDDVPIFTFVGQGFDIATAVYAENSEEFYVGNEESAPQGLTFNNDGTKMFIVGQDNDAVFEYILMTAYDISTAVYSQKFYVGSEEPTPVSLTFNMEGTKMFIIGYNGDSVIEYTLEKAYDVSTAVYSGESEEFYVGNEESNPYDVVFSNDGTKMYVVGSSDASVVEYVLENAYDVSTAVYSNEFYVGDEEYYAFGVNFNIDGTKMYVVGSNEDAVIEYTLSTGYDLSTAVYSQEFYIGSEESSLLKVAFNADGTRMFIVGTNGKAVVEYHLSSIVSYTENDTDIVIDIDANAYNDNMDTNITYSLDGTDASLFNINESGQISFNESPDYESPQDENLDNTYKIQVLANSDKESSSQTMLITVILDEVAPTITSSSSISINENATGAIYTCDANEVVTFSLGINKDENLFNLSEDEISFVDTPDFESPTDGNEDNEYVIDIIATDHAGNNTSLEILITVTDVDEVAPTITSSSSISIEENLAGAIYTAKADESVIFSLGTSKDEDIFTLLTDEISFTNAPDFEDPQDLDRDNDYIIDVIAIDATGNSTVLEVTITVTDVDVESPLGLGVTIQPDIYPNPTLGKLTINVPKADMVEIYDLSGNSMIQFSSKEEVDITNLAAGPYILMIKGKSGSRLSTSRIIKK